LLTYSRVNRANSGFRFYGRADDMRAEQRFVSRDLNAALHAPVFSSRLCQLMRPPAVWSTHGAEATFMALQRRRLPLLRRLIEVHHADVNGSNWDGQTLLRRACFLRNAALS